MAVYLLPSLVLRLKKMSFSTLERRNLELFKVWEPLLCDFPSNPIKLLDCCLREAEAAIAVFLLTSLGLELKKYRSQH